MHDVGRTKLADYGGSPVTSNGLLDDGQRTIMADGFGQSDKFTAIR